MGVLLRRQPIEALSRHTTAEHTGEGSHMEKIRRLLTVIAGVAILGGLGLAAADPAAASSGPYVDAHATGWAHPQVRPTFITVGNGCAPQEHHLQWSHWGKYTAF